MIAILIKEEIKKALMRGCEMSSKKATSNFCCKDLDEYIDVLQKEGLRISYYYKTSDNHSYKVYFAPDYIHK